MFILYIAAVGCIESIFILNLQVLFLVLFKNYGYTSGIWDKYVSK